LAADCDQNITPGLV